MALSYRMRKRVEKIAKALYESGGFGEVEYYWGDAEEETKEEFRMRAVNAMDYRLLMQRKASWS